MTEQAPPAPSAGTDNALVQGQEGTGKSAAPWRRIRERRDKIRAAKAPKQEGGQDES